MPSYEAGPGAINVPGVSALGPNRAVTNRHDVLAGLEEGSEAMQHAGQVTAAAMFGMAQAAVRGSGQVAQSVVSMITQIAQSLPGVGGIFGTIIGGVGGLASAFLGREKAVPVRMTDIDRPAVDKLRESSREPIHITTVIEQGGVEIHRIARQLHDLENRDEIVRTAFLP